MFERFTEKARQVVVFAQDEARELGHNYIGTEHLLLGLLRVEDGLAAKVLGSFGVTHEAVREQIVHIVGTGDSDRGAGMIPFTPRAKKVLELALREALSIGHNYIGTEHVLLGLARENQGVASRILLDLDVTADRISDEVFGQLGTRRPEPRRLRPRGFPGGRRPVVEIHQSAQWEYRVELCAAASLTPDYLNALGTEAWELVATVPQPDGALQLIFKRPCRVRRSESA